MSAGEPIWAAGDWWIVEETGWQIAGLHEAPPNPRWREIGPFRWLCVVSGISPDKATIEVYQNARVTSSGRIERGPGTNSVFFAMPDVRMAVDLGSMSVVNKETLNSDYPLRGIPSLIRPPAGKSQVELPGGKTLAVSHRQSKEEGLTVDSIVLVHDQEKDALAKRTAHGLKWSANAAPAEYEERQEWHEGDKWCRRMVRYSDTRPPQGSPTGRFGKQFWEDLREHGWPEDKPDVATRLVDQGNLRQRKPPFAGIPPE
ncbi:MAG: hypothetical protein JXB04_02925 [Kiritimatiellae bacterium]|nr:hypothetical protein [Kiritimatiellia bacterium]